MAGPQPGSGEAFLQGLFGTFQQAAQQGASTATVWSRLRQAVGTPLMGGQPRDSRGRFISTEQAGANRLRQMGIGIQQVNALRAAAGSWLSAKQRLAALNPDQSITASHIFNPSWATTGLGRANPPQYRLRILRGIGEAGSEGTSYTHWSTYDLGGSLGTLGQIIARANQAYGRQRYSRGTFVNEVLQYEIEVV